MCKCKCGCSNELTIEDRGRCRQCVLGSHWVKPSVDPRILWNKRWDAYYRTEQDPRERLSEWEKAYEPDDEPVGLIGLIGTAEECEATMRRMTNGERGCANPSEHRNEVSETELRALYGDR